MTKRRRLRSWTFMAAAAAAVLLSACSVLRKQQDPEAIAYATPELKQQFTQERFIRQASKLNSLSYTLESADPKTKAKITDRISVLRKPAVIRMDSESGGKSLSLLRFADGKVFLKNGNHAWHEVSGSQLAGSMALRYDLLMTPLDVFHAVNGHTEKNGDRVYAASLKPSYGLYTETLVLETDKAGNVVRCKELLASGRSMKNTEFKNYKDVNSLPFPEKIIMVLDPDGKGIRTYEFKVTQCKINEPLPAVLFERPVTEEKPKSETKPQAKPAGKTNKNDKQTIQHKTGTEKP